jgi:mannitol-specific phosphotransferase system IIBC component
MDYQLIGTGYDPQTDGKMPLVVTVLAVPITCLLNWGLIEIGLVTPNKPSSILGGISVFFTVGIVLMVVAVAIHILVERARVGRLRRADEDADRAGEGFPG